MLERFVIIFLTFFAVVAHSKWLGLLETWEIGSRSAIVDCLPYFSVPPLGGSRDFGYHVLGAVLGWYAREVPSAQLYYVKAENNCS